MVPRRLPLAYSKRVERDIPVLFYREDQRWIAQAVGVEVSSFGDTFEDATAAITEALELYFEGQEPGPAINEVRIEHLHVNAVKQQGDHRGFASSGV
jgi:predicted RNase H-like HicB family nuclease